MQKRISAFFTAMVATVSLYASSVSAQLLYAEGKDYKVLENPLPITKAGQKEVKEFFSYACGHCANLEPHIVKWAEEKKPANVGFYQIPAVGGSWTFAAQAKFVAEKLGLGHDFDQKYFNAVHKERNRRLLGDKEAVVDFMVEEGDVDKAAAEKAWGSLQVKSNMVNSAKMWEQAGLTGVPSVIVNGKYVVMLRDYEEFFAVVNFLLETTDVPQEEATVEDVKEEKATAG